MGKGDHPVKTRENFYRLMSFISGHTLPFIHPSLEQAGFRILIMVKGTSKAP